MNDKTISSFDGFSALGLRLPKKTKYDRYSLVQLREWVRQVIDEPRYIHYPDFEDPIVFHFNEQETERLAYAIKMEMRHNKKCKKENIYNQYLAKEKTLQSKWNYIQSTRYSKGVSNDSNEPRKYRTFHDAWALALVDLVCKKKQRNEINSVFEYIQHWSSMGVFSGLHPSVNKRIWEIIPEFIYAYELYNLTDIEETYPLVEHYRNGWWKNMPDQINWKYTKLILRAIDNNISKESLERAYAQKLYGEIQTLVQQGHSLSNHAAIVHTLKKEIELLAQFKDIRNKTPFREIVTIWLLAVSQAKEQSHFPSYEIGRIVKAFQFSHHENMNVANITFSIDDIVESLKHLGISNPQERIQQWKVAQQLEIPITEWLKCLNIHKNVLPELEIGDVLGSGN